MQGFSTSAYVNDFQTLTLAEFPPPPSPLLVFVGGLGHGD